MDYGKVAGIHKPVSRIVFGANRLQGCDCRGCRIEALNGRPSRFWIGHSSSDATHSTRRAFIGTLRAWIRERRNRDEIVVISNGCHRHLLLRHLPLSASDVSHDLHASLCICSTTTTAVHELNRSWRTSELPASTRLPRAETRVDPVGLLYAR